MAFGGDFGQDGGSVNYLGNLGKGSQQGVRRREESAGWPRTCAAPGPDPDGNGFLGRFQAECPAVRGARRDRRVRENPYGLERLSQ